MDGKKKTIQVEFDFKIVYGVTRSFNGKFIQIDLFQRSFSHLQNEYTELVARVLCAENVCVVHSVYTKSLELI